MGTELVRYDLIKVEDLIFIIRGVQVMLDRDLAEMYQVETRILNQAVKRNINRFPEKFRFQLTENEIEDLRSQFVTSNSRSQFVTLKI
ncbi:ORF6N domain-containing protein [Belliella kenyensis]|uniref:ORF6N domain-containing protein n=1 Tax=Belliella kenyensis TaxID=1472724 RepID=A0ABV8EIG7_9BACT|nr:ORF6N domain-containing protein [Belliella kenyensis]MCH7401215.1 ORF6N domain-containing protein [Belliella kenyensis]MDN3602661.1 ORF6N domain-containing protein [Belliella kenyensis]